MDKTRKQKALRLFNERYSCAQSIMLAYCDLVDVKEDFAFRISSGFEGGISKLGKTCGTLNAAVMLLSLRYGETTKIDEDSKMKRREIIRNFMLEFMKKYKKGINCADLLTEEKDKTYIMHSEKCASIVGEVCDLLDKYMFL